MKSSTVTAIGRLWRRGLLTGVALVVVTIPAARGQEGPALAKALAAWKKRQEDPKSVQYFCDLEMSKMTAGPQKAMDPFAPEEENGVAKRAILARTKVMFALSGKKIAYTKDGDHLNTGTLETAKNQMIYDGARERSLYQCKAFSAGEVDSGSWAERMLLCNMELIPFFLAHQPIRVLEGTGYELDRLALAQAKVLRNGHECVEYVISRPGQSLASRLCVDPSRGYLPLEYADSVGERVVFTMTIEYVPDPQVAWRISEIHVTSLTQTGAPKTSWFFKVTDFSINDAMDDLFALKFPEGTQVIEGTNIVAPIPDEEKNRDKWKQYTVGPGGKQLPKSGAPDAAADD